MNFATGMYVRSLFSMSRSDIGDLMRTAELAQGYKIVKEASWLDWDDWTKWTIISTDGRHVRLVALEAVKPGTGAFTRLIEKITAAGLVPVLVEPGQSLVDWAKRRNYKTRTIGRGRFHHTIWHPRR
jgi:hypothetical protein